MTFFLCSPTRDMELSPPRVLAEQNTNLEQNLFSEKKKKTALFVCDAPDAPIPLDLASLYNAKRGHFNGLNQTEAEMHQ